MRWNERVQHRAKKTWWNFKFHFVSRMYLKIIPAISKSFMQYLTTLFSTFSDRNNSVRLVCLLWLMNTYNDVIAQYVTHDEEYWDEKWYNSYFRSFKEACRFCFIICRENKFWQLYLWRKKLLFYGLWRRLLVNVRTKLSKACSDSIYTIKSKRP